MKRYRFMIDEDLYYKFSEKEYNNLETSQAKMDWATIECKIIYLNDNHCILAPVNQFEVIET